eukprot:TRINITY_DN6508_c0_g2_i1.p1 TRINITY_DN6508_c0_g2~~TRINITY_DN6508_c0_g2_i1.p1  ORF type:complete len:654 (+),score=231.13 TRINITY_DN6508_c0_g2_i1:109-1962(+)
MAEAMNVIERFRAENDQLRANFEELKSLNTHLQNKLNEEKRLGGEILDAKRKIEQTHQEICESLQNQLEAKEREVEELKEATIPTRELERFRLKTIQELEQPHQEKCKLLEEAIEKYKTTCFSLKREAELYKDQVERLKTENNKLDSERSVSRTSTEEELRNRLKSMQDYISELQKNESKVTLLQKENAELQQRQKQLTSEIEEQHARVAKTQLERDQAERLHERQLDEERDTAKHVHAELETLQRKIEGLQRDLSDAVNGRERASAQCAALEQKHFHECEQMANAQKALQGEIDSLKRDIMDERIKWRKEKFALLKQIDDGRARFQAHVKKEQTLSAQLLSQEREASSRMRASRADDADKLSALQNEKHELEQRLEQLQQQHAEEAIVLTTQVDKYKADVSNLRARMEVFQAEKTQLEQKMRSVQQHTSRQELELERKVQLVDGLVNENMSLQAEIQDLLAGDQALRDSLYRAEENCEALASQLRATEVKLQQLEGASQYEAMYTAEAEKSAQLSAKVSELSAETQFQERRNRQLLRRLQHIQLRVKARDAAAVAPMCRRAPSADDALAADDLDDDPAQRTRRALQTVRDHLDSLQTLQNRHMSALSGAPRNSTPL